VWLPAVLKANEHEACPMLDPVVATGPEHELGVALLSGVKVIVPLATVLPVAEDGSDTTAVKAVGALSGGAGSDTVGGGAVRVKPVLDTVTFSNMLVALKFVSLP